jgi:hypothetical protein
MLRKPLLLFILLAVVVPAPASAFKLKQGIYDCTGSVANEYVNSVKIMGKGKYLWAANRRGTKLVDPTPGKFRRAGKQIRWRSGVYKRANRISTVYNGYFSIDRKNDGIWTGISCYWDPNPGPS